MKHLLHSLSHFKRVLILTLLLLLLLISKLTHAQVTEDKTGSPYFYVKTTDTTLDALPLKANAAEVVISGVIANVTVRQTYCNTGSKTLEAVYVFPLSTRAAIHYMQMTIGQRVVLAKIEEKKKAQQMYDSAVANGQTASLLKQERPNVFQMNLGNILPGDTIVVEMRYTELLVPKAGEYTFVYPTVVGPRYVSPTHSDPTETWTATPYQQEGLAPMYSFDFNMTINGGLTIKNYSCTSHPLMTLTKESPSVVGCNLSSSIDSVAGTKDVIVSYELAGDQIESGVLLYEGENEGENFFVAMIQPPKVIRPEEMPPHEYTFIVDVSGSMFGFPLDISKQLMENMINDMNSYDKFNILFFDTDNFLLYPKSIVASPANKADAIEKLYENYGGGGTEVLSAVSTAMAIPRSLGYKHTYVIATDGYVDVEKQTFDYIKDNLKDASFYALGIGTAVNRYFIEGVANAGQTIPMVAVSNTEAIEVAAEFKEYIQASVLSDITISFKDFAAYEVEPQVIGNLFPNHPVVIYGKWTGEAKGSITLSGKNGSTTYSEILPIQGNDALSSNEALKYLWARKRIEQLSDYGSNQVTDSIKDLVTALGLKYNLVTEYTSFIAIDSFARAEGDTATTVQVPNPLPGGVSNGAVGGSTTGVYTTTGSGWLMTGIEEKTIKRTADATGSSTLLSNYPNPFKQETTIKVSIAANDSEAQKLINIYDVFGRLIKTIDISSYSSGDSELTLNLEKESMELTAGIYYVSLWIDGQQNSLIKMTHIE